MFFPIQIWLCMMINGLLWNPYDFSGNERLHQDRKPKKELTV